VEQKLSTTKKKKGGDTQKGHKESPHRPEDHHDHKGGETEELIMGKRKPGILGGSGLGGECLQMA